MLRGDHMEKQEKKSASGRQITYPHLFWLFIIGSVIGVIIEGVWYYFMHDRWETHVVTIWGPYCIIYGLGAAGYYAGNCAMKGKNILLRYIVFARMDIPRLSVQLHGADMPENDSHLGSRRADIRSARKADRHDVRAYAGQVLELDLRGLLGLYGCQLHLYGRLHGTLEAAPRRQARLRTNNTVHRRALRRRLHEKPLH